VPNTLATDKNCIFLKFGDLGRGRAPGADGVPAQISGAEQNELRTLLAPSGVEQWVSEQALIATRCAQSSVLSLFSLRGRFPEREARCLPRHPCGPPTHELIRTQIHRATQVAVAAASSPTRHTSPGPPSETDTAGPPARPTCQWLERVE
jgi:hypothetical protein